MNNETANLITAFQALGLGCDKQAILNALLFCTARTLVDLKFQGAALEMDDPNKPGCMRVTTHWEITND